MEKIGDIVADMINAGEFSGIVTADDRLYYKLTHDSEFQQRAMVIIRKFFDKYYEGISDAIRSIAFNSCDADDKDSLSYMMDILVDHSAELYRQGHISNLTPCLKAVQTLYKEVDAEFDK